jgi:hypothetical protein
MKQSTETITTVDMISGVGRWRDRWTTGSGRNEAQRSMRTVRIVMVNEHAADALTMPAVRDQQQVQALGPNGPDEAFRDRVRCWRSPRRPNHLNTVAVKHRVELVREFLVTISDEKPRPFRGARGESRQIGGPAASPIARWECACSPPRARGGSPVQ